MSLKLPVAHWDRIFIQFIENKLPQNIRVKWVRTLKKSSTDAFPKFDKFKQLLEDRIQSLDIVEAEDGLECKSDSSSRDKYQTKFGNSITLKRTKTAASKRVSAHLITQDSKKINTDICSFYQVSHYINLCKNYTALIPAKRKEHAIATKLCFNCLSLRYNTEVCT